MVNKVASLTECEPGVHALSPSSLFGSINLIKYFCFRVCMLYICDILHNCPCLEAELKAQTQLI